MSRALIVDDNRSLAETVADVLETEGYEPEVVASGAEALIVWRQRPADLLVVDVDLPDIEGLRLARRLAGRGSVDVVVMSARQRSGLMGECRRLGGVFLPKPFSPRRLLSAIRSALRPVQRSRERLPLPGTPRLLGPRKPRGLLQSNSHRRRF
jgi:DNA-binding response OmpR family regulator